MGSSSFYVFFLSFFLVFRLSHSIPFIVLHGISDQCSHKKVSQFTELLRNLSNTEGYCIEVGGGTWDSWFLPMTKQAEIVCNKVKEMEELRGGYNIVGRSQGNLIARGVVEFCDGGPPVKNFVSLGGPHAGTASVPLCGSGFFCRIADDLIKSHVYKDCIQTHLAPSGYLKLPNISNFFSFLAVGSSLGLCITIIFEVQYPPLICNLAPALNIPDYLAKCRYLPKLNNELPDERNLTYKERFSSLENLVLIMFEQDTVLIPKETSWFGYYPDGAFEPVLPPQQTKLYIEDWIGLKALDDAGRVKYISVQGKHLGISEFDVERYVVPYLVEKVPVVLDQEEITKSQTINH